MRISHTLQFILAIAMATLTGGAHADAAQRYCPDFLAVKGASEPSHRGELTFSPYTHHWSNNPEHKQVLLGALDRHLSGGRFCGLALFTNSFGQGSAYAYVGQQWNGLLGNPKLFSKVSAGLLWGYRGEYKDKIPFNQAGIAPAVIPSLGYYVTPKDSAQVYLLGNAGLLFAYTRSF
jgi:hypothetical protein